MENKTDKVGISRDALPPPPPAPEKQTKNEINSTQTSTPPCLSPTVKPALPSKPKFDINCPKTLKKLNSNSNEIVSLGSKSSTSDNSSNVPSVTIKKSSSKVSKGSNSGQSSPKPSPPKKPDMMKQKNSFDGKKAHLVKQSCSSEEPVVLPEEKILNTNNTPSTTGNVDIPVFDHTCKATSVERKTSQIHTRESFNLFVELTKAARRNEQNLEAKISNSNSPPKPPPQNLKPKFQVEKNESSVSEEQNTSTELPSNENNISTEKNVSSLPEKKKWWGRSSNSNRYPSSKFYSSENDNDENCNENNAKSSSKKSRRPSAKFYTDNDSNTEVSVSSGSKFYTDSEAPSSDHMSSQTNEDNHRESGKVELDTTNLSLESENKPTSIHANKLPVPSKKPALMKNLTETYSSDSDNNFASPPLPRKTTNIRDSVVSISPHNDTPVAPLRKKKTVRKRISEMHSVKNEDVHGKLSAEKGHTEINDKALVLKKQCTDTSQRINSTSFTTEDFDIFQRHPSQEVLDDKESKAEKKESSTCNITVRSTTTKVRDREKRRSKSVGAPGFNIFGVKLKPVASPRESKIPNDFDESRKSNVPWALRKLKNSEKRFYQIGGSGAYDNNFEAIGINHLGKSNSLPNKTQNNTDQANQDGDTNSDVNNLSDLDSKDSTLNRYTILEEHSNSPDKYSPLNSPLPSAIVTTNVKSVAEENTQEKSHDLLSELVISEVAADNTGKVEKSNVIHHEYADIDTPENSLKKGILTANIYDEIEIEGDKEEEVFKADTPKVKSENDSQITETDKLQLPSTLIETMKKRKFSSRSDDPLTCRLERKLSKKLPRKMSRKLSRKLTRKFKENKYGHLKKFLIEQESDEEDEDDAEDLEFSETDSEFDNDSFTDESDMEFERELISQLSSEAQEAIYQSGAVIPKVQRIAQELLATEKSYVGKLALLDQTFHFKILVENRQQKMFPDDVIPQMFSNIKSIYQFHHDFLLPQLEKRIEKWDEVSKIGDVMKKFAPFLKLYTEYVQNFDNANQVINSWMEKSPKFNSLILVLQKQPECGNLSLQHHMLGPIQRVPRYELLLKDYLKHLEEDSDDKDDTEKALELVTTAAKHSNDVMRKNEKFRKLLDLNQTLGGTINLVSPTRELVKQGKLSKIAARNGLLQDRYLYLFNDILLVCQSVPVTLGIIQQYKIKAQMEIEGMQVLEGDNLETPNTFYIKTKQKILEFHTETSEEKVEWQMALWNVISEFTKKKQSRGEMKDLMGSFHDGNEKLGKHPPKWIKDQETSQCMLCGSLFTLFWRRHHCRACGKVVCKRCSNYEAKLEYDNNKLKRVCEECHSVLTVTANIITQPVLTHTPAPRRKGVLNVKASDPSILAGYLHMTQDRKTWLRRYFAIHSDFVLYSFKARQDVRALTSMPLPGYVASEMTDKDEIEKEHVFKVSHGGQTGGIKTYYFQCDDSTIKTKWMDTLKYVVNAELPPDSHPHQLNRNVSVA